MQWRAMRFDRFGHDIAFENTETRTFAPNSQTPVKLIGTNMAFRKSALREVQGFDEAIHFFLVETDIKLRLDMLGWHSTIVPLAQVHHHFAASSRRTHERTPTDLFEIGASKAYFCKKHAPDATAEIGDFVQEQHDRLVRISRKHISKRQIATLLATLQKGFEAGQNRQAQINTLSAVPATFARFPTSTRPHIALCAGMLDGGWLEETAASHVADGYCVSAIRLRPSVRYFQVSFQNGFWLHDGGAFGRAHRSQPIFQPFRYKTRFAVEVARINALHHVKKILCFKRDVQNIDE